MSLNPNAHKDKGFCRACESLYNIDSPYIFVMTIPAWFRGEDDDFDICRDCLVKLIEKIDES